MDLKRLRHALELARQMNFVRAAEKVHLSQPAFSRSIQALETELGVTLFDRGTRRLAVTAVGAQFLERAKRLDAEARNLQRDMLLTASGELGHVAFGIGPVTAAAVASPLLLRVRQGRPGLRLALVVNNWQYLLGNLRAEDIEFFIADTHDFQADADIAITPLLRLYGGFACRPGHPMLTRKRRTLRDLLPYGFASVKLPPTLGASLAGLVGGEHLPIAVECDNLSVLTQVVRAEDLIMIIALPAIAGEIEAGLLQPLPVDDLPSLYTDQGIVELAGRTLSPAARLIIAQLKEIASEIGPSGAT